MSGKYIVRQPIKDAEGNTIGHEILYHGANQAFSSDNSTSSAEFAAANTIYSFLTQNSPKVLRGTLNFMTFTTNYADILLPGITRNECDSVIALATSGESIGQLYIDGFLKPPFEARNNYDWCTEIADILGVKEAGGDLALIQKTRELCPEDFYIWSGNDDETAPIMLLGGKGVISVAANIVPRQMHQLTADCLSGNFTAAGAMQLKLSKLMEALFWEVNPIPVKTALAMMGYCQEILRLPMCEMEPESRERLAGGLAEYGLI